jgi:hypothetical protein
VFIGLTHNLDTDEVGKTLASQMEKAYNRRPSSKAAGCGINTLSRQVRSFERRAAKFEETDCPRRGDCGPPKPLTKCIVVGGNFEDTEFII